MPVFRRLCNLVAAAAAVSWMGVTATAVNAQEIRLSAGTTWPDGFSISYILNDYLKPKLEEYSDGRLTIDAHLGGSLCAEQTCAEQVKMGQVDLTAMSVANYGGFGKTFEILTLPYLFKDNESAREVFESFLADELKAQAVETEDLQVLAIVPMFEFRSLQNNVGPIKSPDDMQGVKFRVTRSPLDGALVRAWGGVAVPIQWSETYDALQQGVVNGIYIQNGVWAAMKFWEVAPHATETGGAFTPMVFFMDRSRFQKLPEWAQDAIVQASDELQRDAFDIDERFTSEWEAKIEDGPSDVAVYTPTEEEMTEWRLAGAEAWVTANDLELYDAALVRRVLEAQDGLEDLIARLEELGAL